MELILSFVSIVLGVAGISYGVYQDRSKAKIVDLTQRNGWSTYQSCFKTFQKIWFLHEATIGEMPPDLAKAEANIRELLRKCIENVVQQYPHITEADLIKWKEVGN